ncbi:hypothetical protein FQA39_LY08442 [Lamprigera yunnana]|nr:hypothetical protein FQA39_LY08442 [Lamprigera yunnana]
MRHVIKLSVTNVASHADPEGNVSEFLNWYNVSLFKKSNEGSDRLDFGIDGLNLNLESDVDVQLDSEDEGAEEDSDADCVGCGENYNRTKKLEDWIKYTICKQWLHENCIYYNNMYQKCGENRKE